MDNSTEVAPSCGLLRQAVSAARPGGATHQYFADEGAREADMRERMAVLVEQLRAGNPEAAAHAAVMLRLVATVYKVQYFKTEYERPASDCILRIVGGLGWWKTGAPSLLGASEDVCRAVAQVVSSSLQAFQDLGARREFSLVTKFLHFSFPETFVIFDSQAAKSINQWASFAFRDEGSVPRQFDTKTMSDPSGKGYAVILSFYRRVWHVVSERDRADAMAVAKEIETDLRGRFGMPRTRVEVVDLVDKLLWKADGNPIRLGLVR